MLTYSLLHPELLAAVAAAGHGATILLADGNYPHSTGASPRATRIHLNLRPGLVTVTDVLLPLTEAIVIESAAVMELPGVEVPAHAEYRRILGDVPVRTVERFAFYEEGRSPDLAVLVATADQRLCANLLLTVGVRPAEPDHA